MSRDGLFAPDTIPLSDEQFKQITVGDNRSTDVAIPTSKGYFDFDI